MEVEEIRRRIHTSARHTTRDTVNEDQGRIEATEARILGAEDMHMYENLADRHRELNISE